jgi:hypothetical protein
MLNVQIVNNPMVSKLDYKPLGTGEVSQARDYIIANPNPSPNPVKGHKLPGMKRPYNRLEKLCP